MFGNALARAGKGAAELDGVVTALTQIKAKGVVSAEEINQIAERLPQIRTAMQDAFGTANTEDLQARGIEAQEFIDGIVASLEKLPQAGDGFSNQVANSFDNLVQGAARVGQSLNENLRVGERLSALSEWAIGAADAFGNLDESTQRWVLGIAVAAVAIGPAIRAGSALVQVGGAIANTWTRVGIVFQQWLVASANPEAKTGLISWWKGLNGVMKANIIGVTIGVVLALGAAFALLSKDMGAAAQAQAAVNDVTKSAIASVQGEKATVETLVSVINDNTRSLREKEAALKQLQQISPKYFGDLDIEKEKVVGLTGAMSAYISSLEKSAIVKHATDEISRLSAQLADFQENSDPSILQEFGNNMLALATGGAAAAFVADRLNKNTKAFNELDTRAAIQDKIDALRGLIRENIELGDAVEKTTDKTYASAGAMEEAAKKGKVLKEVLSDIDNESSRQEALGLRDLPELLKASEAGLKKLLDAGFRPNSAEVQNLANKVKALSSEIRKLSDVPEREQAESGLKALVAIEPPGAAAAQDARDKIADYLSPIPAEIKAEFSTDGLDEAYYELERLDYESAKRREEQAKELAKTWRDVYVNAAQEVASTVLGIFSDMNARRAEEEIASLNTQYANQIKAAEGNAALQAQLQKELEARIADVRQQAARRQKRLALAEAVINTAVAVTKALTSAAPPFNIPAAIAAGIAGAAQIATIAAQPLAKGTRDFGGGLALVGERGAELVNLPQHSQVFPTPQTNRMLDGLGRAEPVIVGGTVRFDGRDMYLMIERQDQNAKKTRGYGLAG